MSEEQKIRLVIQQYMESVLLRGDIEKSMETVSDDIIGIGMGTQGIVSTKQELWQVMSQLKLHTLPYRVEYAEEDVRYHPPGFATARIVYKTFTEIKGRITQGSFIQTIAARKEADEWKLCLVQATPLHLTGESIESYPLHFADRALVELKSNLQQDTFDLINKSFSGGIFGTYMTENYPLYFANTMFAEQMGYTRDEFYELFSADATKIIYEDDRDRILGEVNEYIEQGVNEYELKFRVNTKAGGFVWLIEHARKTEDTDGIPVLLAVTTNVTEMVALQEKLSAQNEMILSSIRYASKIQKNLLPQSSCFEAAFSDAHVLWKPRDIVGGDIYWLKNFAEGTLLAVCDCTGHGTPGALLTMLVSSMLDNIVQEQNDWDTARLMLELDQRISAALNVHAAEQDMVHGITDIYDGCDLALLWIAKDGTVTLSSAGITVLICDGHEVRQMKGQRLQIGAGLLTDKKEIRTTTIPPGACNTFYIASDGLYDQIGGVLSRPFGYGIIKNIILQNHAERQHVIVHKIWEAFEHHRGQQIRRDDVELIAFKP